MPRTKLTVEGTLGTPGLKEYELKPNEKMARITILLHGASVECLVPGCEFRLHVPVAARSVMEHELKDYYRDHRSHRHIEYRGRTLFEFEFSPDWPTIVPRPTPEADDAMGVPSNYKRPGGDKQP